MKTPIISPSGLSVLSLVVLAGCDFNSSSQKAGEEPDPMISVSIAASAPLPNVQKLSLQFSPSHIYAPCDDPEFRVPSANCRPSNIRVFTNGAGQNRVVEPISGDCYDETIRVPRPVYDPDNPEASQRAYELWLEAGGEYQTRRVCPGGLAKSTLTLIDSLSSDQLPTAYIARDNRFVEGTFDRIIVQAWGMPRSDSYVDLLDGRRCDVNVLFPNDLDSDDPNHYADFLFPASTIRNGEHWRIDLQLDFSGTVIDPAACADGLDLVVAPGSATAHRIEG